MKRFSIRRRLLWLLLGSLVLVWGVMLAAGYRKAHEEIHQLADIRLQQGAHTLLALDLKRLARLARLDATERKDDDDDADEAQHGEGVPALAFQVWSDHGELLLASKNAPPLSQRLGRGYATLTVNGEEWRTYSGQDYKRKNQVTVLEPLALRNHPAHELAGRMAQVLLLALLPLAVLLWISIRQGLKPLTRLSEAIHARDADNLEPLQLRGIPDEVQPLIGALNHLLERLTRSLDKERAFTADAAHELRTPLAAIKVQAEVALAATDAATSRYAMQQVIAAVNRTTHLAQQLLLLARLEQIEPKSQQIVDLAQLAADGISARADAALRSGIEIELVAIADALVSGDPTMLGILLDNLLDNAIKYGGEHGQRIVVTLQRSNQAVQLLVADDGEGVAADERARLPDRFFRVAGHSALGSGLGLSIVAKIAAAHGGALGIGEGLDGRGLGVSVCLPFRDTFPAL